MNYFNNFIIHQIFFIPNEVIYQIDIILLNIAQYPRNDSDLKLKKKLNIIFSFKIIILL